MHRKHTTAKDGMQSARSVSHSGKTLRWYLSIRPVAVLAAAAAALLTTGLVAGPLAGVSGAAPTSHALATTGLGYTPLASPVRIADTRAGATDPSTYAGKTLAQGANLTVDVPASAAVPANASAVVVNVTAITPTNGGFLTVYPGGSIQPASANVTFTNGQTVGDNVTVGLGTDSATGSTQSFTVHNGPATGGATVDFTADVMGYYAPQTATSGAAFVGLTPARIFDSRTGSGQTGAGTTLTNGGSANVTVVGVGGVPATASAVVLNVAITNPTASSFIAAFPAGTTQPGTANQNFLAGETLSSQVVAKVGAGGAVTIANHAGNVDIVVDVDGYFTVAGGAGPLLTVLATPVRLTDTRPNGNVLSGSGGVAGGGSATAVVQGTGATAGVLSLADITTVGDGNFLTAYPTGGATPLAATVNYVPGDTYNIVENASYAAIGTGGSVSVLNGPANAAPANIVVDEAGFFAPPQPPSSSFAIVASPSPATINVLNGSVGGDTSTVTVTVTGASGSAVAADMTHLTLVPSVSLAGIGGSCGTLAPGPFNPTGGAGQFVYLYTASPIPGTCTIKATEANQAAVTTTVITQLPVTNLVSVVAAPTAITGNGITTSAITTTVTSPLGAPVVGDSVSFVLTPEPGGTCGTGLTTFPTNAAGVLTETYTSSTISPNFCQIVATEAGTLSFGSTTIDQTSGTSTVATVTVNPFPATVDVQPSPTPDFLSNITVTVQGASSTGIVGDPVQLVLTPSVTVPGAGSSCGTLGGPVTPGAIPGTFFGPTGAGGTISPIVYTASPAPGTCTITATEGNNADVGTSVITQLPVLNNVAVTAVPLVLTGNGVTTSVITATVTNPTGTTPVPGDSVTFTASINGGLPAPLGGAVLTNAAGQATISFTSFPTSEFVTITATESSSGPPGGSGSTTLDLTST